MAEEKTMAQETEIVESPPQKMEFRLINPTEGGFLKTIKWNREELEAAVREKVAVYQNVVYTEDNLKQAKADRAELNKLTEAIEERRKKVKSIIMEPYTNFESEVKEVLELIKEPAGLIDRQIKDFEDRQKEEKKNDIRAAYDEVIGDLADVLPFEKVFESRYLNKTYKLSTAQADVKRKVERVRTDLETIDSLDSKYKLNAKDVYIKTLNLSKALAENKRLSDLEEKLKAEKKRKAEEKAEKKRLEEEERQRAEAAKQISAASAATGISSDEAQDAIAGLAESGTESSKIGTESAKTVSNQEKIGTKESESASTPAAPMGKAIEGIERQAFATAVDPFAPKPVVEEKKFRTRFCAVGTRAQLEGLIKYMQENGIEYGRIK